MTLWDINPLAGWQKQDRDLGFEGSPHHQRHTPTRRQHLISSSLSCTGALISSGCGPYSQISSSTRQSEPAAFPGLAAALQLIEAQGEPLRHTEQ